MDENIKDKAISLLNIGIETGDWETIKLMQKYLTKYYRNQIILFYYLMVINIHIQNFMVVKMTKYVESRGGKFDNTVFMVYKFSKNIPEGICITTEDVSEAQDYLGNEKVFFGRNDVLIEPNLIIS
jgi:hypothetical protein